MEQLSTREILHSTQGLCTHLWHVAALEADRVIACPHEGPILKAVSVDDDDDLCSRVGI